MKQPILYLQDVGLWEIPWGGRVWIKGDGFHELTAIGEIMWAFDSKYFQIETGKQYHYSTGKEVLSIGKDQDENSYLILSKDQRAFNGIPGTKMIKKKTRIRFKL